MDYTIVVKGEGGDYTAVCYEIPSLQVVDTQIEDAVLQLVDLIERGSINGEPFPEPLEFTEAFEAIGL